jgi:hypothetical protein
VQAVVTGTSAYLGLPGDDSLMFKRIKAAFLWSEIIKRYQQAEYGLASAAADKYRQIYPNVNAFRAIDATLDILRGNSDVAEAKFGELLNHLRAESDPNKKYIMLYSKYYICLINKGMGCDQLRKEALSVAAYSRLTRWLPLPLEEVPIELPQMMQ